MIVMGIGFVGAAMERAQAAASAVVDEGGSQEVTCREHEALAAKLKNSQEHGMGIVTEGLQRMDSGDTLIDV